MHYSLLLFLEYFILSELKFPFPLHYFASIYIETLHFAYTN